MAIDLKHLAIKIYSVCLNLTPEEQTVSIFTWLTPALRSQMSVSMMTVMTQIQQYYKMEQKVSNCLLGFCTRKCLSTCLAHLATGRF